MSKKGKVYKSQTSATTQEDNSTHKSTPPPSFNLDDIIKDLPVAPMFGGGRRSTSELGDSSMSNEGYGSTRTISAGTITAESLASDPNYIEISKSDLSNLPKGAYLRYVDINNVVKPGGKLNAITTTLNGEILLKFGKYNVASRKYFAWSVRTSQIGKIYKYNVALEEKKVPIQPRQVSVGVKPSNSVGPIQGGVTDVSMHGVVSTTESVHSSQSRTINPEDQFLNQLGGKILLDNGVDELKTRVSAIETAIEKLDSDLKKLFILVKRIYKP